MARQELTRDEIFALAGAFPVRSARTLLSLAGFPFGAVPENGYANAREFWALISEELGAGVMSGGRVSILRAALDWYPANGQFAALAVAAEADTAASAGEEGTVPGTVTIIGGQGIQVGNGNIQLSYGGQAPASTGQSQPPARAAALRVLVIGANPLDADLPYVRADQEARAIESLAAPGRLEVKVVLGATATDVRHVGTFRPDIVHFACHGTADSLVFSDRDGESDHVAAARVADTLRLYRDQNRVRLRGVVLAACDGEHLAPAFTDVADTVIAHRGRLADQCGVAFAEQLYATLNTAIGETFAGPDPAAPSISARDLEDLAREAAQLAAQYSAACDPVITNLIVLQGNGSPCSRNRD